MKRLIDQFVCVRLVKANDLDLTRFQFDYDLTFAVFFANADGTIYGRYGTRSSVKDATREMTLAGLAKSMAAALTLHKRYPANKKFLAGKQPVEVKFKKPSDYPSLRGKIAKSLNYQGAVTKSCLHCHQVRDAERQIFRDAGKPIPDELLFPQPSPQVIGLSFDPRERATVSRVEQESVAARAGVRSGDRLLTLGGQAILSQADVQWVLHNTRSSAELRAVMQRGDRIVRPTIKLSEGWRRHSDISWRVTSWPLRRMVTGGLLFTPATKVQRHTAGVSDDSLALTVKHVGQYGPHAAAKRAGFKKGDLIVSYSGIRKAMSPSELLSYGVQNTKPGQRVEVTVVRNGKRLKLKLPMQK